MASNIRLDISVPVSAATVNGWLRLVPGLRPESIQRVASYIHGLSCVLSGRINVVTGAVKAAGTFTFTGRPTADETLTVAGVTLTAKDSGANGTTEFNTSASVVATTAANLAATINANTTLNKIVVATSALGVVTVTSKVAGLVGNYLIALTESMTNTATATFSGGAEDTNVEVYNGY
jgi:hypothetical protein